MRILSVGGGSGGHVTPVVAVVKKLHQINPESDLRVWCDRRYYKQTHDMISNIARVDVIASGKLRRYANLTIMQHIKYHLFRTHLRNFFDLFKFTYGILQSIFKLIIWRPDVIFLKGGFVCLPVGLAAHLLQIPMVIHDSDTVPGLTNRILSKYATKIGTGAPTENYPNYPKDRTEFVGIPIRSEIKKLSGAERNSAMKSLGLNSDSKFILAVGGGGGASRLNRAVVDAAPDITDRSAEIILVTGRGKSDEIKIPDSLTGRLHVVEFLDSDKIADAIGSANVVVSRAGATFVAEFAAVGVPLILIPSRFLAGDHQTKNAAVYSKANAAIVLDERDMDNDPQLLSEYVNMMLNNPKKAKIMSENLKTFARNDSLDKMVSMIVRVARKDA